MIPTRVPIRANKTFEGQFLLVDSIKLLVSVARQAVTCDARTLLVKLSLLSGHTLVIPTPIIQHSPHHVWYRIFTTADIHHTIF